MAAIPACKFSNFKYCFEAELVTSLTNSTKGDTHNTTKSVYSFIFIYNVVNIF